MPPPQTHLSPLAFVVEALDLLGRAHTLHTRSVDPNDLREIDDRKDMTMTITAAATRWFGNLPPLMGFPRAMEMMIVSRVISFGPTDSARHLSTMRELATAR